MGEGVVGDGGEFIRCPSGDTAVDEFSEGIEVVALVFLSRGGGGAAAHLRRDEFQGAGHGGHAGKGGEEPHVRQLGQSLDEEDVFRLDVPVGDARPVQVGDSLQDALQHGDHLGGGEWAVQESEGEGVRQELLPPPDHVRRLHGVVEALWRLLHMEDFQQGGQVAGNLPVVHQPLEFPLPRVVVLSALGAYLQGQGLPCKVLAVIDLSVGAPATAAENGHAVEFCAGRQEHTGGVGMVGRKRNARIYHESCVPRRGAPFLPRAHLR